MKEKDNQISSEKHRTVRHFLSQKRQAILAAVLTVLLLISIPVFAWLYYQRNMETVAMIKVPMALRIGEGDRNAIEALDLSKIDVTDTNGYKDVVFCVYGKQQLSYHIQLAHTTNIGFNYEIYSATKADDGSVKDQAGNIYKIGTLLNGGYLNRDSTNSKIADNSKHGLTYPKEESNTYDKVQENAEPLYWKTQSVQTLTEQSDVWYINYYVLRVSWAEYQNIRNDKETDMVYLMAEASGS